ncbi:hypothetical protein M0P25_01160 [archaeon]|nr:hypothetical protein [archaeon]
MGKEEKKRNNFFSKIYSSLEKGYYNFSNWLTKKGINLNALNKKLENKGVPPFILFGSILLIIILLVLFLFVFNVNATSEIKFSIQGSDNKSINDASLVIKDVKGKKVFSGTVNNNDVIKINLKPGKTYSFSAMKDGYKPFNKDFLIESKEDLIVIVFNEIIQNGILQIKIIDSQDKRIVANALVTVSYLLDGKRTEISGKPDKNNFYDVNLQVPINKDIELIVSADKYQDHKETIRLNSEAETRNIELVFNSGLLEGKSRITFVVNDEAGELLNDSIVEVYNLSDQLIAQNRTVDGRAIIDVDSGSTINYKVSKEEYRTFVSDPLISFKILNKEEIINITLKKGGSSLKVKILDSISFNLLQDASVSIYDQNQSLLDNKTTDLSGTINFQGLETNSEFIVVGCKQNYFCESKKVSLINFSELELRLEEININNSAILEVFVVDFKNLPVDNAKIKIFEIKDEIEYPYNDEPFVLDATGGLSLPLKVGSKYLVYAYVGDVEDYQYITISNKLQNRIIFTIEQSSKILTLDLLDSFGQKISSGHVSISAKDGTILYDSDINSALDDIMFRTDGYSDFILNYTDSNGVTTTGTLSANDADSANHLGFKLNPKVVGDFPIIDFVGIQNSRGEKINYISPNNDYYLIFDVIVPQGTTKAGVHIRAGEDTVTDSENQSYGITGFMADTTNFTYSTTYNPLPEPGSQSIDVLNQGNAGNINKWIELKWDNKLGVTNKQIKIKVKAIDSSTFKPKFKYRAWVERDFEVYRDPQDSTLQKKYSTNNRQQLYADTKEITVELFDVPAECKDDICVSYSFIDSDGISYSKEDFFALKGDVFALEATLYSNKNRVIKLNTKTSTTQPAISFISADEGTLAFPTNFNLGTISELELNKDGINLRAGERKKVYTYFVSKAIGVSYIDSKFILEDDSALEQRLSFEVLDKRYLRILFNPDLILPFGSKLELEVFDSANGNPIENAFIKIEDEQGQFIRLIKGDRLNGRAGKYVINSDFVVNKLNLTISAYGYVPFTKQLLIADDSVLVAPKEVLINLGVDQISQTVNFNLENISDTSVTDIYVGEPVWVNGADTLTLDVRGPPSVTKKNKINFQAIATVSKDALFDSAYANVPIYGLVGNRQVATVVSIRINRGLIVDDCLVIAPKKIDTFVGLNTNFNYDDYYGAGDYQDFIGSQNLNYTPNQSYNTGYGGSIPGSSNSNSNYNYYNDGFNRYINNFITSRAGASENTVVFTIQNKCEQIVFLNPKLVPISSNSNNDLEIILNQLTILPGEEKLYDVLIKNTSDREQIKKYKFNILWENSFYNLSPTELNVDLIDVSKALWVAPTQLQIYLSQTTEQQPAITSTRIMIKNIGNVPITDIQISTYPQIKSANIGVTEYPREIKILEPGKRVPVDLKFTVNINRATLEDMYFVVTGKAAGVKNPVFAKTTAYFLISSPNCLKISPKNLDFTLNLGEKKARNISINNQCAEPVAIVGIDKRLGSYQQAFGNNAVSLVPTSGMGVIPPNGFADFSFSITANAYGGQPKVPVTIIGQALNSGNYVTSESTLVSLNILSKDQDEQNDFLQSFEVTLPVCNNPSESKTVYMPLISVNDCTGRDGYCDSYGASELILSKIDEMYGKIQTVAAHSQNQLLKTGCSVQKALQGYCPISDLGGDLGPVEFDVYLQNDSLSYDLVKEILSKSDYKFKKYFVDVAVPNSNLTGYGTYQYGGKINIPNLSGCGKYKLELNAFIGANQDSIFPNRVNFLVNLVSYKQTEQCEKSIENYLNYLPWDIDLTKNKSKGTWLTVFSGDENVAKEILSGVSKFEKNDNRYVKGNIPSTKQNHLNIRVGKINEDQEALAKIYFNDLQKSPSSKPEQLNIVINNRYAISGTSQLPEKVLTDAKILINNFISKTDYTENCISENLDYMLILKVIKAGRLEFDPKEKTSVVLVDKVCTDLNIVSDILENVVLNLKAPNDLNTWFEYRNKKYDSLGLDLKQGVSNDFNVCYIPQNDQIYNLVGKDIIVSARSIYSTSLKAGNVGQRKSEATIHLSSCGVTPVDVLEIVSNKVVAANKDGGSAQDTYYALVDWNRSYNPTDTETLCDTINKYIEKNPSSSLFFDYKLENCNTGKTKAEKEAKNNKAINNALTKYFVPCMATCTACTAGTNAIFGMVPVLGQIKLLSGVVVDCGIFACGLPSASIYLNTVTGKGFSDFIDGWLTKLFIGEQNKQTGTEIHLARSVVGGIEGMSTWIAEVFNGTNLESPGATTLGIGTAQALSGSRMVKATPLGFEKGASSVLEGVSGTLTPVGAVVPTPPVTPPPVTPPIVTNVPHTVDARLGKYVSYMNGTSTSYSFVPHDPAMAARILPRVTNTAGAYIPSQIESLTASELDDLVSLIRNGTFSKARPNLFALNLSSLASQVETFAIKKYPTHPFTFGVGATATTPPAGTAGTPGGAGATALEGISQVEYDDLLNTIETQKAEIKGNLDKITAEKAKLTDLQDGSKKWYQKHKKATGTKKALTRLEVNAKPLEDAMKQLDDLERALKPGGTRLTPTVVDAAGNPKIPINDAIKNQITDLESSVVRKAKVKFSAKLANFGAGMFRALACGILGNVAGSNVLTDTGITGLDHSVLINDNVNFNRNTLYKVDIIDNQDSQDPNNKSRYDLKIESYVGSTSNNQRIDNCSK